MARVLIIDDDPMVTRLLQEHLSNEGYEVMTMLEAEEGFAEALKTPPDLILLDVNMPDATGFQLCGRFRQHPLTRSIPIIMMTGTARWPNQQAIGLQMGANEYILKPFDVIQVGDRVHSLLGSKRPVQTPPAAPVPTEPIERVETPGDKVETPLDEQAPPAPPGLDAQRFFDFSVETLILASRLPRTRAGRHMADQLLRCGTPVGARIQESESAGFGEDSLPPLRMALKDIRETGYWLMLIRKAGILEAPSLEDLETKCQELTAILSAFVNTPKQSASFERP